MDKIFECGNSFNHMLEIQYIFTIVSNLKLQKIVYRHSAVYIFIRKRVESDNYVVVSFFKKSINYKGDMAYWMRKEKIKKRGTDYALS